MTHTRDSRARPSGADAILATALLTITVGLGIAAGATPNPTAVVGGSLGTVVLEVIAGRFASTVRDAWARQPVRVAAIGLALGGLTGGILLSPDHAVSLAVAALTTYLVLLGLVSWGVLAPPSEWGP